MPTRSLVLLSGGLDSAVALFWAINRGYEVDTLTFDYFHRGQKEIQACAKISRKVNCQNHILQLNFLREIQDEFSKGNLRNPKLSRVPSAYIPCRNIVFYGIAASIAESSDARFIIGGHNKDDALTYPDSSSLFFDLFNKTASIGRITRGRTGRVILPLARLDKSEVVRLGSNLRVPFELTWSCYKNGKNPCDKCPACILRKEAFEKAGIEDPLLK